MVPDTFKIQHTGAPTNKTKCYQHHLRLRGIFLPKQALHANVGFIITIPSYQLHTQLSVL